MGTFREIFTVDTGIQVLAGTAGLSASMWGPKLLGHLVWAPLGRGWGGVATSVVSAGLFSIGVGMLSPRSAKPALLGGLIGAFAGALSALHCGVRQQVLPFETGLLACALPTMPQSAPTMSAAAQSMYQGLIATGVPAAAAAAQVKAAGLSDYVFTQGNVGLSGYGGHNPAGVNALLANEQAFRSAAGGLNDYSAQIGARSRGMGDYAQFPTSDVSTNSTMDASPESF